MRYLTREYKKNKKKDGIIADLKKEVAEQRRGINNVARGAAPVQNEDQTEKDDFIASIRERISELNLTESILGEDIARVQKNTHSSQEIEQFNSEHANAMETLRDSPRRMCF